MILVALVLVLDLIGLELPDAALLCCAVLCALSTFHTQHLQLNSSVCHLSLIPTIHQP